MYKVKEIYSAGLTTDYNTTSSLIKAGVKALTSIDINTTEKKKNFDEMMVLGKYGDKYWIDFIQNKLEANPRWSTVITYIDMTISKYKENWNRSFDALYSEYNPIDNYNKKMEYTTTENGENTDTGTTTNTGELTEENTSNSYIYGYDSEDPSNDGKTADNNKSNKSQTENVNLTHGMNKTTTYTETTTGNIGVMDTQTMINKELQLRTYNLIDEIFKNIFEDLTENYWDLTLD